MFDFKGFFSAVKKHWLLFAVTVLAIVVFGSSTVLSMYRKAREMAPVLPEPKA